MLESLGTNKYDINLEENKPLFQYLIYSLILIELETFKAYIETHLGKGFIWLCKFFAKAFILLIKKLNNRFYLYVNYQGLNNLTIKNRYLFLLIGKVHN